MGRVVALAAIQLVPGPAVEGIVPKAPRRRVSLPRLPKSVSLPLPPARVSSPAPPLIESSPGPPGGRRCRLRRRGVVAGSAHDGVIAGAALDLTPSVAGMLDSTVTVSLPAFPLTVMEVIVGNRKRVGRRAVELAVMSVPSEEV